MEKDTVRLMFTEKYLRNAGSNVANVGNANPDGGLNVNDWNRDRGNHNVGAVCLVVSSRNDSVLVSSAWWHESSRQASCQFLASLFEVQDTYCFSMLDYPWLVLKAL